MTILQPRLNALVQAACDATSSTLVILRNGESLVNEILDGQGDRPIKPRSVTEGVLSLLVEHQVIVTKVRSRQVPAVILGREVSPHGIGGQRVERRHGLRNALGGQTDRRGEGP
ncbi:hypothetical protein ACFP9V_25760 [Deinococcus radiopugnans]|uniref:Uncharacterized protein n=1 Tax=Deinococcus radiopugnans ATCC 19172 TaxID=585398 RepID=A0ABR6NX36_9DEIO|nr:hypothetical protein [Deinococcus radiopugnans]MBB6018577.1 hypothetical protein [Deinococcus radiopugnans ATCC 19172]